MRALLPLLALLLACDSVQIYRVEGKVVSIDEPGQRLEVAHHEIEGFMPAMVMKFKVADPSLLEGVEPGNLVRFELERRGTELRILKLEVTAKEGASGSISGQDFVDAPAPDFELVDQEGRTLGLRDLRGKTLLVDFIFTRCPGPCPIQTAVHVALQRSLPEALAAHTHFVSITLDPEHDGPEQLKEYAERHGADPASWSFLSGDRDSVTRVAQAYHVAPSRLTPRAEGPIDHVMARYVIDPQGRIARRYVGPDHTREALLADLVEIAGSPAS
jgi:protein SCO1/2